MTQNQIRLSVCMIAKDERERLPLAIGSVKRIADEVVVVDTGSSDDSIRVAESLGARVTSHQWKDDFAAARNASIAVAKGQWILCLDADEVVPPESEGRILAAICGKADAYYVRIESLVDSSAGRVFVNFFPRLFKNLKDIRFEGRVHEQIYPSLERLGAHLEISDIVLKHLGYAISKNQLKDKARRNADLLHREIEARPDDALSLFHLGEAYSMMEDHECAAGYYERALKAGKLPKVVYGVVLQNLGSALVKLKKYGDATRMLRRALEVDPDLLTVYLVLASALFGMKRFDKAEKELLTYISRSQATSKTLKVQLGHQADVPTALVLLAKCRLAKGDLEKAKKALKDVVAMDKSLGDAHILLGRIAFEEMKFGQAVVHYEDALRLSPDQERLYFELARAYVACGSDEKAISTIEAAIKAGLAGAELQRCLGLLKIKKKDLEGAIQAYKDALALHPDDSESKRRLAGLYHILGNDEAAKEYLRIQ